MLSDFVIIIWNAVVTAVDFVIHLPRKIYYFCKKLFKPSRTVKKIVKAKNK